MLRIEIGGGRFLVPCREVERVITPPPLSPMPCTPAAVLGAFIHRGALTRVVDLCRLLYGTRSEQRISTRVILARVADGSEACTLGLLAERVVEARACEGTPISGNGEAGCFRLGWVAEDSTLYQLLDVRAVARAAGIDGTPPAFV